MPVVLEVEKFMKREESANVTPSLPAIATLTDHSAPLVVAKSSPLESNGALPVVGLCESSSQPSISTFEASCSNTVCKPPANHIHAHEDMSGRPCDANEACDALRSASSPIAEPVIHSPDHAANDGMSQGSAEMDCSDDDDNTLSRLPSTDRPHVEPSGNNPTTKDGLNAHDLLKELNQEHANDMMHQGCSSLTNKASIEGVKIRDGIVSHSSGEGHQREVFINKESKDNQLFKPGKTASNTDNNMHDVKTTTGSYSTNLQMLSALQAPASPKIGSTRQSPKTLDNCTEKNRNRDIKSERSLSPCVKLAASCSEDHSKITAVKMEHGIESEEVARQFDLRPRDSVIGEDSCGASSSQPHSDCGKVQSVSEKSEYDKSGPESCKTSSAQNERDGQLVGSHWRDLGYAYVNRNERWERFIKSEREKNKGKYQSGKHTSDVINQQRTYHRRGAGSRCHPRNFRGPRNESEIDFPNEPISGRRHPFEDDLEHLHRIPHRRWRSPPAGSLMREMDVDGFPGRETGDLPDDMIQERFFMPHCHRHHARGDHGFIHRERSHSPAPRRGVPVHFHRRQSPEAMHRSPPLMRIERTYMPHCHHSRRHGSPLDRVGHDERGMQRNVRCDQALEGDAFETPLHPAHLAELHAEGGLADRRKYRDRRAYRRSLEGLPVEEDEMLSYHAEDMEFAEGGSGPREYDGRFRNRMGHRARGEQEDGYRHRGHQGWRDGDSNDSRPKRRRH
uniref:Uncharacterized protein n=1 Tax=Arundo donax TaxID=35708 RepID=A0A0A9FB41_ARUDO